MTITEAIKLQNELQGLLPEVGFNKYLASNKLGLEALKFTKGLRDNGSMPVYALLPGETE